MTVRADATSLPYLQGLNPQQREAVEHFLGPILVLAGAGSGKTRVLTARVCHLVRHHGVPPHRILAVTFTNKAAGEMRDRIRTYLGEEPAGMWVGTFHSLGARMLRRHAPRLGWSPEFTIYDQEQTLRQIKRVEEEAGFDVRRWNPKVLRSLISGAKNQLVSAQEFFDEHGESFDLLLRTVARVYPLYEAALRDHNAFDFDDLLTRPVELLTRYPEVLAGYQSRFSCLLVDEYQDTNHAQFRFLELLAGETANLMVVGDDDQSIYGWRGADIRNILDFEHSFPSARVVRLEQNYRSTQRILEAANQVIRFNRLRKGKTLRTERTGGEPITLVETTDEMDEARWIAEEVAARMEGNPEASYRSVAVLYRTNAQARALEEAFSRSGIPYQVVGGVRFYERREIQDLLAYLRLVSNPRDGGAFDRVVNYPRRGVGPATVMRLRAFARERGLPLLEAASRAEMIPSLPAAGARGLQQFAKLIQDLSNRAPTASVGPLVEELVEALDLRTVLREEGPEGEDRLENVEELIAAAHEFAANWDDDLSPDRFTELDLFLQQVALVSEVDRHDPEADRVTLMTLHNAKGLEFPIVFISGLEDGLFPLSRSYDDPAALEEERRLFYVGVTRAMDKVYLTHARQRRRGGNVLFGRLSPFVDPIEDGLLERRLSKRAAAGRTSGFGLRSRSSNGRATGWWGVGGQEGMEEPDPDLDLDQDRPNFLKGERVVHPTFGSGTVMGVSGFGPDLKVTVRFDSVGRKKLLARYADLSKDYL